MNNPLDPIMSWYRIALDSMRVTTRVLEREIWQAVTERHVFHRVPVPISLERLENAKDEVADLVIVALVATFERMLRDHLKQLPRRTRQGRDSVDEALQSGINDDIEYWRLTDRLLRVFRGRVGADLIGQIRQIIGHRNWVAHGRADSIPPDGNVVPEIAYEQLTQFLRLAGII